MEFKLQKKPINSDEKTKNPQNKNKQKKSWLTWPQSIAHQGKLQEALMARGASVPQESKIPAAEIDPEVLILEAVCYLLTTFPVWSNEPCLERGSSSSTGLQNPITQWLPAPTWLF